MKTILKGNKLLINGKTFTSDNMSALTELVGVDGISSKENDGALVFYGPLSAFSSFHTFSFTIQDQEYCSMEQYVQYQRAVSQNLDSVARKIRKESDPFAIKKIFRALGQTNDDELTTLMKESYLAKFVQHDNVRDLLLQSGTKRMREANKVDSVRGIGIGIRAENVLQCDCWSGKNIAGKVLEEIRDELRS